MLKTKEGIDTDKVIKIIDKYPGCNKKELITKLNAKKSIDKLLKNLLKDEKIIVSKKGRSNQYFISKQDEDFVTKMIEKVEQEYEITQVIKADRKIESGKIITEIDQEHLDRLAKELESKIGKEITAILHTKKDRKPKSPETHIFKNEPIIEKMYEYKKNPFKFILNFFDGELNGEKSTKYFKVRDTFVVKSIYNKFRNRYTLLEQYNFNHHKPFYRVMTISNGYVKLYHLDMHRIVKGVFKLFKITDDDLKFLKPEGI